LESTAVEAGPEPRAGFAAWWMVGVLLTFYILSYCDRIIITLMTEDLKADLHLSDVQLSLILGPAFAVCYAVAGFPLGWAADRFPRRIVVWAGTSVWSLATVACGLVSSFFPLFFLRAAVGVGEASLSPAAYSLIADRFPRRMLTRALSVFTMGPKAGSTVAYAVGAAAIALGATLGTMHLPVIGALRPWQFVFLLVGAPGLILALLAFSFREPPRRRAVTETDVSARAEFTAFVLHHRKMLILLIVGFSLLAVTSNAMMSWAPAYLTRRFGWTAPQYGPYLAVASALGALTLPIKGSIVDWLYGRGMSDAHLRFYTWTLGFAIPFAVLAIYATSPVVSLLCFGVVEVVALTYVLYFSALIQLLVPNQMRGRMTGLFLFVITMIGQGFGPTLVASITDYGFKDASKVGWSMAIVSVVAMTTALILFRFVLRIIRPLLEAERAGRTE
jgi:MFS family permease